jgi:hypothetical protein
LVFAGLVDQVGALTQLRPLQAATVASPAVEQVAGGLQLRAVHPQQVEQVEAVSSS